MIRTERSFDSSVQQVRAARLFAQDVVADWGLDPDDAVLVVGELAANAQRHGRSEFNVSLDHVDGALLVEVSDASPEVAMIDTLPEARRRRGLVIVDRVAVRCRPRSARRLVSRFLVPDGRESAVQFQHVDHALHPVGRPTQHGATTRSACPVRRSDERSEEKALIAASALLRNEVTDGTHLARSVARAPAGSRRFLRCG